MILGEGRTPRPHPPRPTCRLIPSAPIMVLPDPVGATISGRDVAEPPLAHEPRRVSMRSTTSSWYWRSAGGAKPPTCVGEEHCVVVVLISLAARSEPRASSSIAIETGPKSLGNNTSISPLKIRNPAGAGLGNLGCGELLGGDAFGYHRKRDGEAACRHGEAPCSISANRAFMSSADACGSTRF